MKGIIIYILSNSLKVSITSQKGPKVLDLKLTPSGVTTKLI